MESTINTSWNTAATAPKLNCHFLNLSKIYKKITSNEKIIDHKAETLISSAIVGPTF